jgi:ATP-dependent Clp protease protease subunit
MTDGRIENAILVNEFTEFGVKNFKIEFDDLRHSNLPVIPIYIDSFGGEVYSLMAMLDIMSTSDRPIATIALGKAMSCGSILLASGSKGLRYVGPNSTVMIHDAGSCSFGKIEDLKSDVGEADRLNSRLFEMLNEHAGKKPGYFQAHVTAKKHANWYLSPQESLKHGIVDHIGIPMLQQGFQVAIARGSSHNEKKLSLRKKPSIPTKPSK